MLVRHTAVSVALEGYPTALIKLPTGQKHRTPTHRGMRQCERESDRYIHAAELQTEMERAAGGSGHPLEIQGMKTPCAISN